MQPEVESSSYSCLLAPVFTTKVPQELQLTLSRKIGGDDWNLDALMSCLEEEIQAQGRMAIPLTPAVKKLNKEPATATALLAGSYCQQDHAPNSCSVVPQPQARMPTD